MAKYFVAWKGQRPNGQELTGNVTVTVNGDMAWDNVKKIEEQLTRANGAVWVSVTFYTEMK